MLTRRCFDTASPYNFVHFTPRLTWILSTEHVKKSRAGYAAVLHLETPPLYQRLVLLIAEMSAYAITPETYVAWRFLELDDELRPFELFEREHADITKEEEELALLYSSTNHPFS